MRFMLPAASLLAQPCLAADVSGEWEIAARLGEIPISVHCELVQFGDALSGTCTPVMQNPETSELTGNVDGTIIQWSYDVVFNGNPGHVAYDGEILSDTRIAGSLDLSGTPSQFTAVRRTDNTTGD